MTTANVRNVLRVPGRLCINPTDLSTTFPHGGTALGLTRDIVFRTMTKKKEITAEEWGGQTVDVIFGGDSCVLACVLREFDNDALSNLLLDTAAGSSSSDRYVRGRANRYRAGKRLSSVSVKLMFSPRATVRHPAILIYKALPLIDESTALAFGMNEELAIPVTFHGTPDATGRVYSLGRMEDLTL